MSRGGKRAGAGRPSKEPTKVIRVPESKVEVVKQLISDHLKIRIPIFSSTVRAGFPSPADDYIEDYLDLNEYLIKHPAATFMVRASGDSMINASINSGDILVVDRSIEPSHGKIIIAAIDGELTVKRLYKTNEQTKLLPENPDYPEIELKEDSDMVIWGVVTNVIHELE